MLLFAVATEREHALIAPALADAPVPCHFLITGVGPIRAAVQTCAFLAGPLGADISLVVNLGIGGAYAGGGADLLDLCLASSEHDGDCGICRDQGVEPLSDYPPLSLPTDQAATATLAALLAEAGHRVVPGPFVTANAVSADPRRGENLQQRFSAVLENMEGAAVAHACRQWNKPFVALRAVSNLVEKRDRAAWRVDEALENLAVALGAIRPRLDQLAGACHA